VQTSRLNAMINALPISQQQLQKVANWTIGLSLFAVAAVARMPPASRRKMHEEWAQASAVPGFRSKRSKSSAPIASTG
jgi:cell division protein FtsQ